MEEVPDKKPKLEEFSSSNLKQEDDTFGFETESMALKENPDYLAMLNCLNMLTALRTQALQDIDKVLQVEDEALANPLEFIAKLQNGESIGIPDRLIVPEVPEVDLSKYHVPAGALRCTRPKPTPKIHKTSSEDESVRGRPNKFNKAGTYNQLWTAEEQLRLEELLVKFPPERSESKRFLKIAEALGNRTLQQVTSRCQKYFIKLHANGLPVPGRIPRSVRKDERKKNPRSFKLRRGVKLQSTFFPRSFPPVFIREDGDLPGTSSVGIKIKEEPVDSDESSELLVGDSRRVVLHRRVRADLSRHGDNISNPGFMCNICKEAPLKGTRWHCMECEDVDFCSRCLIRQLEDDDQEDFHPLTHPLASYRPVSAVQGDKDYNTEQGPYNYLDPAFRPDE